jgi:hypothetical protein
VGARVDARGGLCLCKIIRNGLEIHSVGDMCSWLFFSAEGTPEGQLAKKAFRGSTKLL